MSQNLTPIDLRSDTVTRPSPKMREAMAVAAVGDDQYEDDPTMNLLQERVADVLGQEAALWLPTGTMANQVALKLFTRPGDDVIVSRESHAVWHETGASGALGGVQFTAIGDKGIFTTEQFIAAIKPQEHPIYPPTTLVEIENTHNRMGGIIFPQDEAVKICEAAKARNIATYLDGARLWNAAAVTEKSVAKLAAPFDLVMVSISKGLGAPGGSLLAGPRDLIRRAVRYRRMLGGAMRQVGFYAAAGLYALDHNVERLAEDHHNAQQMAAQLTQSPHIVLDPATVHTNILVFRLTSEAPSAHTVVDKAREQGVLINALDDRTIRAVTHLDVTAEQGVRARDVLLGIVGD